MNLLNYLILIVLGLIVGSFLNVVILRFDDLKSALFGHSRCPKCKKNLIWYELIPVVSYIALRGKCRNCKKTISVQYPLVEIGTALIFSLLYWRFGFESLAFYFYAVISAILIVIFVYDILEYEISDWLVIIAGGLWVVYLLISVFALHTPYSLVLSYLYGGLALGGFLFLLVAISREKWMGAGDVGLGLIIGLFIGWPNVLVAAFTAFFLGAIVGMVLILAKTLKAKDQLPFAPFLILGFWIAILFAPQILNAYFGMFF